MSIFTIAKIKIFFPSYTVPTIKKFILLMECILQCRTVCLYKCRDKASQLSKGKKLNIHSEYVSLIRFFKMKRVEDFISGIQSLMLSITKLDLQYLIVDRSNWKRGAKNFNLLTIGNLMENIFMPIYWLQLNKRGNSNIDDRTALIEGLSKLLNKAGKTIAGSILLADREFIGQIWFEYLLGKNISFVIRLRENMYFDLQTFEEKKNFVKVISQRNRALRNICNTNGVGRYKIHLCND